MSLPAASAPLAVLVLAWDEATPAVRALVEAAEAPAPTLDSVVVLVPGGPVAGELTQEEFLPLDVKADLRAIAPLPTAEEPPAAAEAGVPNKTPAETTEPAAPAPSPLADAAPLATLATSALAAAPLPSTRSDEPAPHPVLALPALPLPASAAPTAAPRGQGLRIVRLSTYSLAELAAYARQALPAPTWAGASSMPMAPYLGSAAVVAELAAVAAVLPRQATAVATTAPAAALPATKPVTRNTKLLDKEDIDLEATPTSLTPEQPAALDAEPDTAPAPVADASVLPAEDSTTERSEEAAEVADTLTVDVTPVQAGWHEALASLQTPATFAAPDQLPTASSEPLLVSQAGSPAPEAEAAPEPAAPSALRPVAQQFDAPNLNFQIIQYARFAVPLALAEQPFAAIYAPAWPTWLAAQELRQRTGRPLVLHVASLAAAEHEPLDLAAGWVAEIQRQALHRADLILTETLALAQRLRHELALPAHRVRTVPAADAAAVAQALHTARTSTASPQEPAP